MRYGDVINQGGQLVEYTPVGFMPVSAGRDVSAKIVPETTGIGSLPHAPVKPLPQAPLPAEPMPQLPSMPAPPVSMPAPQTPPIMAQPGIPPVPTPVAPPPMVAPVPAPTPMPTPVAPPPMVEPAPALPPVPPATPDPMPGAPIGLSPEIASQIPSYEEIISRGTVGPVAPPVVTPPVLPPAPAAPEPSTGIETLAPDDFTAPAGIVAGPMSTPAVNTRADVTDERQAEEEANNIPMPDGSTFSINLGGTKTPEGVSDTVYAGGTEGFDEFSYDPSAPVVSDGSDDVGSGFNLTDEQQEAIDNFIANSNFDPEEGFDDGTGEYDPDPPTGGGDDTTDDESTGGDTTVPTGSSNPTETSTYQVGGLYFDNIQDARAYAFATFGNIDGVRAYIPDQDPTQGSSTDGQAAGDTGTGDNANIYANQEWYNNLTEDQREAFDNWVASGGYESLQNMTGYVPGLGNINFGGFNPTGNNQGGASRAVVPIAAVEGLQIQQDNVPTNVSVATNYELTGATPPAAPSGNPFQRPETQGGIGSLAGGG